jgi:hypothetical protein
MGAGDFVAFGLAAGVLGNPSLELTHTIRKRVEVKGGSQPPLSAARMGEKH